MNIEHYRNFVKIVEAGTIFGAANILHITQPGLSNQLKALEQEYGTTLLKRGSRHVELTNAGRVFYEKARLIVAMESLMKSEVNSCISGTRGTLHIGLTPSYPDFFTEKFLISFCELYPQIIFEIFEAGADTILQLLKDEILEVAIMRTPRYMNPLFKSYMVVKERLSVVFHRDNPWISPELQAVSILDLKDIPLSVSQGFRENLAQLCSDAGFTPFMLNICSSRAVNMMWPKYCKAVSILATAAPETIETDVLCCRPIIGDDLETYRSLVVFKDHQLSSVAQSFTNFITSKDFT